MSMSNCKYLSPREVADRIGVHRTTLVGWRRAGVGPQFVTLPNGRNKYPEHLVDQWITENLQLKQVI